MENGAKLYKGINIKECGQSEIEIKGEMKSDSMSLYRKRALKKLGESAKIAGFRKGHIPEKILIGKVGEQTILEEAAEIALADAYPQIVTDYNLKVLGKPQVTITKLAPGNPVGFTIRTALEPDIELPDYKEISEEILKKHSDKKIEVTEKEISEAIEHIKKNMPADKDGVKEVQELNNEFIKKLGDFESVSDFKAKLKENIFKEKERHAKEKIRVEIVNKIIHEAVIVLPNILIESELEKMLAQFKDDIAKMNLSFKEYLEKIKKSEDDLRREWGADADKRAKLQLVLNEIAKKENIVVPKEDIQKEVKHLLKHYKGADAKNAELYITSVLTNEKVFKFLENQK